MSSPKRHPFSKFGPAPYRYAGNVTITVGERGTQVSNPELSFKARCGTCANCGHGIMDNYVVMCGDGSMHSVGSDCIHKIYDDVGTGYEDLTQIQKAIKLEKSRKAKAKRQAKESAVCAEILPKALALYDQHKNKLATMPHPNEYLRSQGKSYADYFRYFLPRGGSSSKSIKSFIDKINLIIGGA